MSILQCCSSCCLFLALENAPCGVTTESARQPASRTARVVLSPQQHTHVSRGLRLDGRCSLQAFHAVSWTRIHSGNPLSWRARSSWSTQIFPLPARLKVRRLDRPFSLTDQHLRSFRTAAINSQELDPPVVYSSASCSPISSAKFPSCPSSPNQQSISGTTAVFRYRLDSTIGFPSY